MENAIGVGILLLCVAHGLCAFFVSCGGIELLLFFLTPSFLVPGGNPHRQKGSGAEKVRPWGFTEAVCCRLPVADHPGCWVPFWFFSRPEDAIFHVRIVLWSPCSLSPISSSAPAQVHYFYSSIF
ncbi:hypothetical protein Taro_049015 [Colocasia esculenta]|uniref:Uncharacterized protein n=1 Tax=Colocasia esculenta TaxID=4460 RepID=A0A843X9Q3_COLES|nr:hypothetical protein [Colocasia esculenta]